MKTIAINLCSNDEQQNSETTITEVKRWNFGQCIQMRSWKSRHRSVTKLYSVPSYGT